MDREDIEKADSPLMKLPAELRIKIWAYVLGDRLIVVNSTRVFGNTQSYTSDDNEKSKSLQRIKRRLHLTWDRLFRKAESAATSIEKYRMLKERLCGYTHGLEYYTTIGDLNMPCAASKLNILYASRQIYNEAVHVFWTTNDFLFKRPSTFRSLTTSLTVAQRNTLTRIHIHATIDPRTDYPSGWSRELGYYLAKTLPALRFLSIRLVLRAESKMCPWIHLDDFSTRATIHAFPACLQAAQRSTVSVSLDRDRDNTRFIWPTEMFGNPASPYCGLIVLKKFRIGDWDHQTLMRVLKGYSKALDLLEMFYEAFMLHHPDTEKVKMEYQRRRTARSRVTFLDVKNKNEDRN
ncbi:MAG: hypothetical protein Q9192_000911 [Flavoplaca navasiana]